MADENILEVDINKEAIQIAKNEKTAWEDASVFITEKVAFQMRNVVRKCRKNYYGVFDEPQDPVTKRDKIWVQLTHEFCEAEKHNEDVDTKDINFKAKNPKATDKVQIVRAVNKNYLDELDDINPSHFGEDLDELISDTVIDGTGVWETQPIWDKKKKKYVPKRERVDLLNVYIDPSAKSIQAAYRFTVRHLMFEDEVRSMKDWINTEGIEGSFNLHPTDDLLNGSTSTSNTGSKQVDVWKMYGKGPKYLITGKKADTEEVDLKIIVSGLSRAGSERVHLIETYNGIKPYEEGRHTKVPGRWYGMGIAEKLMWYQLWANLTVNNRITRQTVAQLGIFKIKKGAGITPQMIARLAVNGALSVNNMDDVENFPMQEPGATSYKDEDVIQLRAQRVTGQYQVATGEQLPASTPATNAAIQQNASQSNYSLKREGIGFFLEKWEKRQVLPILLSNLKIGEAVRMGFEPDELRKYDEANVNKELAPQLQALNDQGIMFDPEQATMAKESALEKLRNNPNRFITIEEALDWLDYDCEAFVTNEKIDKNVLSSNILTAIQIAPEYKDQLMQAAFDIWGLDLRKPEMPAMPQGMGGMIGGMQGLPSGQPSVGVPVPTQNPQQTLTNAVTNGIR